MSTRTRHRPLVMDVSGDFACFTRPEHKAERVSYPVMTPTAARGVLEAVFWKPEFSYRIRSIEVLNEIRWFRIRRNEVTTAPSLRTVLNEAGRFRFDATDQKNRDQRHTLALRDVAYRIHADIRLHPHAGAPVIKYADQFHRRLEHGACFTHPYLGTREFSCTTFGPPDPERSAHSCEDGELGVMLLDIDHSGPAPRSFWFTPTLRAGVMVVPTEGIHDPARDAQIARQPNGWAV